MNVLTALLDLHDSTLRILMHSAPTIWKMPKPGASWAACHHPLNFLQHRSSYSELLIAMEAPVPAARCYYSSSKLRNYYVL